MKRLAKVLIATGIAGVVALASEPAYGFWWGGSGYAGYGGPFSVCHSWVMTPGRWNACLRKQWFYRTLFGPRYPVWGGYSPYSAVPAVTVAPVLVTPVVAEKK